MTRRSGRCTGLGAFVEVVWKDSFYMDNANLLKAPGYELVNRQRALQDRSVSDYLKSLSLYLEVRNLFDRTYVASANNIGNTRDGGRRSKSPRAFWRTRPVRSMPVRRGRLLRE